MKNRPKVQHYVAQSYLRGFAVGAGRHASLYVYERNKARPFRQTPQQAARETDYYTVRNADGVPDDSIEDLLAAVESEAVPVIRSVCSTDIQLSWEGRNKIALFLGFQEFRVPWTRRQIEKLYGTLLDFAMTGHAKAPGLLEHTMQIMRDQGYDFGSVTAQSMRESIERKDHTIEVSPQVSLTSLVQMAPVASAYYREMDWTVMKCHGKPFFITSDNPVVKFAPESGRPSLGVGIMNPAIQIWFPMSKTTSLIIRHDTDRMRRYNELMQKGETAKAAELRDTVPRITYRKAADPIVHSMNHMIACYATRFVFSPTANDALPDLLRGEPAAIQFG
jgi:hypothetical protein